MIKQKTYYDQVYFIDSPEYLTDKQYDNLIMVSTKNWNHYFLPFKTKREFEIIKNVVLLEFETEESMFKYLEDPENQYLLIDYSLEFELPCVLQCVSDEE